jgi:putative (di)nucleoside polyphosphate hydrolase
MFRKNVMMILINPEGKYLLAHKKDAPDDDWYFPGGGIEEGESLESAFFRELYEELGVKKEYIPSFEISKITHQYRWSEDLKKSTGYEGQEQMIFIGNLGECCLDLEITQELDNVQWVEFEKLFEIIPHEDLKETLRKLKVEHSLK